MEEILGRLEVIEKQLPVRVDSASLSKRCKVPYKIMDYRASLIWRFAELTRGAYENYRRDHLSVAILLTRGAVETAVAVWYIYRKVEEAVKSDKVGDLDNYVMRLLLGGKNDPDMPQAINVLTFLRRFDKERDGLKAERQYEDLSEFAHPNWAGTLLLFGKHNEEKRWTDFGRDLRDLYAPKQVGTIALETALLIFDHGHKKLGDLVPSLVQLYERDLQERGARGEDLLKPTRTD